MNLKKVVLSIFLGAFLLISSQSFGQNSTIPENEKPEMLVVSANYGLLLGYAFFIEHRGGKRTGRKNIYKRIESEILDMRNPSDAMNFMDDFGYRLLQVYSFPTGPQEVTVNYVFKKKKDTKG